LPFLRLLSGYTMVGKGSENNLTQIVPRGFLESYILMLLREEPLYGYKIMKKIREKTKFWEPSPGSIYPALQSLVKKGLVKKIVDGKKKRYVLTKKGLKLSEKIKNFEEVMREKTSQILSDILDVDREEIKKFLEEIKKKHKENPLSFYIHSMFNLLFKILDRPEKCLEAIKILKETNYKLRKLAKSGQ